MLQCSHEEAVARQALVALSGIHLQYVSGRLPEASTYRPESDPMESLILYNKSLRQVRRYIAKKKPSRKVVLTCCALFCCFESIRGDHDAATKHLDGGLAVLRTILSDTTSVSRDEDTSTPCVSCPLRFETAPGNYRGVADLSCCSTATTRDHEDITSLVQVFGRLDLQATYFNDDRVPKLDFAPKHEIFTTLSEAQWALDQLQNKFFRFLIIHSAEHKFTTVDSLPLDLVRGKEQLQITFSAWQCQFTSLTSRLKLDCDRKPSENSGIGHEYSAEELFVLTLLLSYHTSEMLLRSGFPEDPSVFCTVPNRDAERLLAIATKIAGSVRSPDSRTYSSAQGIISPLFLLTMKCSDVSVRQRALALLESIRGRREGLYDAGVVADICGKIADMKRVTAKSEILAPDLECCEEEIALEWVAPAVTDSCGGIAEYVRLLAIDTCG